MKTYKELKNENFSVLKETKKEIEELESKVKQAKDNKKKLVEEMNYYRLLDEMVLNVNKFYELECTDQQSDWDKIIKRYSYKTALIEFKASVRFRDDLKKWKYEVKISGQEDYLNDGEGFNGGRPTKSYGYNDYTKKKYCTHKYENGKHVYTPIDRPLEQKFTTLEEANTWALEWMEIMINDHAELIKKEKALFEQAKGEYDKGNIIVLQIEDWDTREGFKQMLEHIPYDDIHTDMYRYKIIGEGISSTIKHIIEQYKMRIEVKAG